MHLLSQACIGVTWIYELTRSSVEMKQIYILVRELTYAVISTDGKYLLQPNQQHNTDTWFTNLLSVFCTFVVSHFHCLAVSQFRCFALSLFHTFVCFLLSLFTYNSQKSQKGMDMNLCIFPCFALSLFLTFVVSHFRCFALSLFVGFTISLFSTLVVSHFRLFLTFVVCIIKIVKRVIKGWT